MSTYRGGYIYRGSMDLLEQNARILAARPDPERPRYARNEAPHGTTAAARRHGRHGEPLCGPCLAASKRQSMERRLAQRARRQKARQGEP